MKQLTLSIIAVFLTAVLVTSFTTQHVNIASNLDLKSALKSEIVTADILSNGKYSGRSVEMTLTNNKMKSVQILIPAGTMYEPENDDEQTLIQLEDELITLKPNEKRMVRLAAFCTEAHDSAPSSEGTFTLAQNTNPKLKDLISYIDGKSVSKKAYQDAVWSITDHRPISNIVAEDAETKKFRTHIASLTGQKDTWYTSPQNYEQQADGRINSETVKITGELKFATDGVTAVHQALCDADGNVLFTGNKATPRKNDNTTLRFSVSVKGWEKGDYMVKVIRGDQEIKRFPFKV